MRTGCQQILGNLKGRDSLLAGHGGKIVKELLETVTGSKVVEKILDRDAGADKHGSATENLRVAPDNRFESRHAGLQLLMSHNTSTYGAEQALPAAGGRAALSRSGAGGAPAAAEAQCVRLRTTE